MKLTLLYRTKKEQSYQGTVPALEEILTLISSLVKNKKGLPAMLIPTW
ncbi:hypothetical protein ALP05_200066 [Pseudomonas caricapapayae]|uniref:Uncharacterized protein n=1 Tax=Pseudomonas caricapapayae TaxID=46678 RepID=A0A3M6ES09_9PSED|nr:hypothetical protein [Pseudomonas caricapapayae]RMV71070.1 hypothetical protein ALP05_200066 [Pseudomonas caricapapayae]